MVYVGVANPKGEKDHKISRLFTESQIKKIAPLMQGLPVHINHETTTADGKRIPPSGIVLKGHVHPKTGKLWVLFTLFPGQTGALAERFLGEDGVLKPEFTMQQLSLGFNIAENAADLPVAHNVQELSICYEGCREGCDIIGRFPMQDLKVPLDDVDTYLTNICDSINKNINNITSEEEMFKLPASDSKKVERPENAQDMATQQQQSFKMVSTQASAAAAPLAPPAAEPMDTADTVRKDAMELMKALQGSQAEKRPREEEAMSAAAAPPSKKQELNLIQYIAPEAAYEMIPPPPGLTPEGIEAWNRGQEQAKKNHDELARFRQEEKKRKVQRLQGAANELIPTLLATEIMELDEESLGKALANLDMINPAVEHFMGNLLQAQASSYQKLKKEKEDINTLQKRFEEENKVYKEKLEQMLLKIQQLEQAQKEAQKPLFLSAASSTPVPPATQQQVKPMAPPAAAPAPPQDGLSMIFAQAAKKSQGRYQDLSEAVIFENASKLRSLFTQ
jgi:hypothetical protein